MSPTTAATRVVKRERLLRISIDGIWSANDFAQFFDALNVLYRFQCLSDAESGSMTAGDFMLEQEVGRLDSFLDGDRLYGSEKKVRPRRLHRRQPFQTLTKFISSANDRDLCDFIDFSKHLVYFAEFHAQALEDRKLNGILSEGFERSFYAPPRSPSVQQGWLRKLPFRPGYSPLVVSRCNFASPGITDLAGLGQVLGHLKDILSSILNYSARRRERQLNEALLSEQLIAAKISNIASQVTLLKSVGYSDYQCRRLLEEVAPVVQVLGGLANAEKLVSVATIERDDG